MKKVVYTIDTIVPMDQGKCTPVQPESDADFFCENGTYTDFTDNDVVVDAGK